jgi:hypothetical protein
MPRRAPTRALALAAFVALPVLVAPGHAHAKASIQGTAAVSAGWTDNVLNAPDHPAAGMRGREQDALFQLMPGAIVASAAPRFIQRLQYRFTADLFALHSEANSYSNTLDWAGFVTTSRNTELIVTLQSQQGRLNTFNLNAPSADAPAMALPTNASVNFFSQSAGETLTWDPTAHWRFSESGFFRAFIPIDRGRLSDSYNFIGELTGDRVFRIDSLGLVLRTDFIDYVATRDPVTNVQVGQDQKQLISSLAARWRRDWSPSWNTEASLGVIEAMNVEHVDKLIFQPSALAAVRFSREVVAAELVYAHAVTPNALVGTTFVVDQVGLQGGVPLPQRTHVIVGATVAYQHLTQVTATGDTGATADLAVVDVSIGWQPLPELGVFARYSLFDQFGAAADLPSLTRNTVLVGLNVIYPAVAAARVPTRQGSRVDRSDQPGMPELHSEPR